jgi:hypothetical protein
MLEGLPGRGLTIPVSAARQFLSEPAGYLSGVPTVTRPPSGLSKVTAPLAFS